eukprot:m.6732 g.6732  ORF g.6732 m.6732 type:complete len:138 (-) comp5464_c0_seq1:227-640(-)
MNMYVLCECHVCERTNPNPMMTITKGPNESTCNQIIVSILYYYYIFAFQRLGGCPNAHARLYVCLCGNSKDSMSHTRSSSHLFCAVFCMVEHHVEVIFVMGGSTLHFLFFVRVLYTSHTTFDSPFSSTSLSFLIPLI